MKLREFRNLNIFLNMLFDFFNEKQICGALGEKSNYEILRRGLLDSEFEDYTCSPSIEQYSIKFSINHIIAERFVDLILFGREGDDEKSTYEDKFTSFFVFSWHEDKIPPFMKDFIDEKGMLITDGPEGPAQTKVNRNEIMTFDEFEKFLRKNLIEKKLKMIDVD